VGREGGALSPELSGRIQSKRGGGQPLEATVRQGMEGVFQVSFGHVRIHADPEADALNRGVAAIAFTVGSDIFFRAGFYQPRTPAGQHLLAHELTHVVQQRTGSLGTGSGNAGGTMTMGAADDRHEQEAEQTAHRVVAALQARGPALSAPAASPSAALSRAHDPAVALAPVAPGVARVPDLTVRRFGLGDLWQAVTGAASAAWGGFSGALRGIAQAGYTAVTGTLHWAQAVVTGAGQLAGQAVTVVANAAHNATQFALTVNGKVVGLVSQVTAQAIGGVMQAVTAAGTAVAAVSTMATFLAHKARDVPAAFVQALQAKAQQVLMGVLGPDVRAILGGAAGTLALILKDPLKFLNNLGLALKAGFGMVGRNLWGVLQGGLMSGLSGSLGVTIPDGAIKFDVAGIITLGLNVLHLGYDALKAGVIAGLTKQNVKDAATVVSRLETGALAGFTLLQTIRAKGLAGAWDALTQQVGDSLGAALDGAKAAVLQWVEQRVVQGVIAQLVALCTPVGDIVELLMTIYKAVQFFLDKMRALGQFMATLKAAVTSVARGTHDDLWHAGAQVYNAVVASVPLLLGFIASLLGLGDVGKPVRAALAALTAPLRRIEAKLVALIVSKGKALAATLHGKGSAAPGHTPVSGHGTDPAHDAQVATGVQELKDLDKAYEAGGITHQQAQAIASRVKAAHPVFTAITVVDGGDTWDYHYVASTGNVTGDRQAEIAKQIAAITADYDKKGVTFTTRDVVALFKREGLYPGSANEPTIERAARRRIDTLKQGGKVYECNSSGDLYSFDPDKRLSPATGTEVDLIRKAVEVAGQQGAMRGETIAIVAFMKAMAQGHTIKTPMGDIDRARLTTLWAHTPVKKELGDILRRANDGQHEWIPCKLILEVINRAADLSAFNEGVRWVYLQHHLRSDTSWIIFKPDPSLNPQRIRQGPNGTITLQGHTGALYKDMHDGGERKPQTYGSGPFHDECCAQFSSNHTVKDCLSAAESVFTDWVWDGQRPALQPHQIDPDLYTQVTGGIPLSRQLQVVSAKQTQRYNDMQNGPDGFKSMEAKINAI